jgi:hypothetical protein
MRVFLTNLLQPEEEAHINKLLNTHGANDNNLIEFYTPFEPSELTFKELMKVRIQVLERLNAQIGEYACLKIHQTNQAVKSEKVFLSKIEDPLIYVVRNPLDVAISFAHHQNWELEKSVEFLNNDEAVIGSTNRFNQRLSPELLGNWSHHYNSWKETVPQMLLIRYEDMLENAVETFTRVVDYLGIKATEEEIKVAISKSKIENIQQQEEGSRFKEGSLLNPIFFRKGSSGEWKNALSAKQVDRIIAKHGKVMKDLGYLS